MKYAIKNLSGETLTTAAIKAQKDTPNFRAPDVSKVVTERKPTNAHPNHMD